MRDLEVRLREDLPRLAALLSEAPIVTRAPQLDTHRGGQHGRARRLPVRRIALVLSAAALVIASVTVFAVSQHTSPHVSVPANPTPDDSAPSTPDDGSRGGESSAGPIPPGQFLYVRTTGFGLSMNLCCGGVLYSVVAPSTHELWIGADQSGRRRITYGDQRFLTPEDEQVFRGTGLEPEPRSDDSDSLAPSGEMHYFDLSELPTDSASLRARLDEEASPATPARLIEAVSDWGFAPWSRAPVAVRKALVWALSSTPGMITESHDGMTVVAADRNGIRAEMWFDDTGQLQRMRQVVTDPSSAGLHAPSGTIVVDSTLEAASLVPSTSVTPE